MTCPDNNFGYYPIQEYRVSQEKCWLLWSRVFVLVSLLEMVWQKPDHVYIPHGF